MSTLIELYIADINNSSASRIDLLKGYLYELSNNRNFWQPIVPRPNNTEVLFENIPLGITGNSINIAKTRAKLDILMLDAYRWNTDILRKNSYWLYWRYKDGNKLQRDLIISLEWATNNITTAYLFEDFNSGVLTVGRRGFWENVKTNSYTFDNLDSWGDYTTLLPNNSTHFSRIQELNVNSDFNPSGSQYNINEYWFGIRELYEGWQDFDPVLPLTSGQFFNGLSNTSPYKVTFTTSDILKRYTISIGDVIGNGNPVHYTGRYAVLLRASASVDTVFILKYGNKANIDNKIELRRVYSVVGNTSIINLGEIEIPSLGNRLGSVTDVRNTQIELWMGRAAGSGSVTLFGTSILLVPAKHYLYIKAEAINSSSQTKLLYKSHEDLTNTYEIRLPTSGEVLTGVPNPRNFHIPYDGGILVCAAQRNLLSTNANRAFSELTIKYSDSYNSYSLPIYGTNKTC